MSLPEALKPHQGSPGLRSYARVLRCIEKEIARLTGAVLRVELASKADARSGLRRFLSLERADEADHWLVIDANCVGRPLRVVAPFRRGLTLPYSLEIGLKADLNCAGVLRGAILQKPRWEMTPSTAASRELAATLNQYPFPKSAWRHESGGIPILLKEGGRLAPAPGRREWPSTWTVISGFQGFVINVGPRLVKYVQAAPALESFLAGWSPRTAAPPRSAGKPAGEKLAEKAAPADPSPGGSGEGEDGLDLPDAATIEALTGKRPS